MSKVTFNTLVVYTVHGEVLEVFVGTDTLLISQLKESKYWEELQNEMEEDSDDALDFNGIFDLDFSDLFNADNLQIISDFYENPTRNSNSLTVRVKYFPNKTIFYR